MQRWILIHAASLEVTSSGAGFGVGRSPRPVRMVASRSNFVQAPRSYAALRSVRSRRDAWASVGVPLGWVSLGGGSLGESRCRAALSLVHHVSARRSSHTNGGAVSSSSPSALSDLLSTSEDSSHSDSFVSQETSPGGVLSFHSFGLSCSPKGRRQVQPASPSWRPYVGREEIVVGRESHTLGSRDPRAVLLASQIGERDARGRGRDERRVAGVTKAWMSAPGLEAEFFDDRK
jgi:hypothetical protein